MSLSNFIVSVTRAAPVLQYQYQMSQSSAAAAEHWPHFRLVDVDPRLDKFWLDQLMFYWKANLTWTGSRSFSCDIRMDWIRLKFLFLDTVYWLLRLHPFLPHAVNCRRFRFWRRHSVFFLFVSEIYREPLNGFAPNSLFGKTYRAPIALSWVA